MEEPESQEAGFVLLEKPRGAGSVLAIDAAFSSLLHSFVRHAFSLLLRDGDGNTEAAQTQTLPSERIWGWGWGYRQGNSSSTKQRLLNTYCVPGIMLSSGSLPSGSF